MGIDIDGKRVTFNGAHEQRVVTDPARAYPKTTAGRVAVVSIFGRRAARRDDFDGNPLIYALKGKFNYEIDRASYREIRSRGCEILDRILDDLEFDAVVPLPSSSRISGVLAARALRRKGSGDLVCCLEKATVGAVLAALRPVSDIAAKHRRDYTSLLHKLQRLSPNALIEMKGIDMVLRPFVTPIIANAAAAGCQHKRVLLVDDIIGSGSSLMAAGRGLAPFAPRSVVGLTLMGELR